jgi:hypothetical protein
VRELSEMGNPDLEIEHIRKEVHDLEFLIGKVKEEN